MNTTASPDPALAPTALIDSDHPAVAAFARENAQGTTERERAVALYLAVRDRFRYDPYRLDLRPEAMRASSVLAVGHGWCVTKAALLADADGLEQHPTGQRMILSSAVVRPRWLDSSMPTRACGCLAHSPHG